MYIELRLVTELIATENVFFLFPGEHKIFFYEKISIISKTKNVLSGSILHFCKMEDSRTLISPSAFTLLQIVAFLK